MGNRITGVLGLLALCSLEHISLIDSSFFALSEYFDSGNGWLYPSCFAFYACITYPTRYTANLVACWALYPLSLLFDTTRIDQ